MGKTKRILGVRGKAARKIERKKIGPLRDNLILASTVVRYKRAVLVFFDFCAAVYWRRPQNNYEVDLFMCAFIEGLWQCGDPRQVALDAVSGLAHFWSTFDLA